MKTNRSVLNIVLLTLITVSFMTSAGALFGQDRALQPRTLKQRIVRPKPGRAVVDSKVRADVVVVKFREGTRVRERSGQFEANLVDITTADEQLLARAGLSRQRLFQDLAQVNTAVAPGGKRYVRRMFTRPEADLQNEKRAGEDRIGEELADLNLYYYILIADANPRDTERLIDALNALDIVEIAYAQPIPSEAQIDAPPMTGSFTNQQGYLRPAASSTSTTNGIDADYAWQFPGGRGDGVKVIDIEQGWNLTHEDLPQTFFQSGVNRGDWSPRQHGTAVLGVVAAAENAYGITGITPRSRIGVASVMGRSCILGVCWWTYDFESAVNNAAAALEFGDIMIIEQHAPGPDSGLAAVCNADQFEFIAMEYWDANFDAIKHATAKGIIVVEAAGNGSMNLDSPIYNSKFDRTVRDSGAILVGGGTSNNRAPMCWTNFGSRVDVQGWGQNVATLGYGYSAKVNGNDDNQYYTTSFSGTSSASPVVAGAAAAVQGILKARNLPTLNSTGMRNLLRTTGMAQTGANQIGPLPNLRAAIDTFAPKRTLKVTILNLKVMDNLFAGPHSLTFTFTVNSLGGQYPAAGTAVSFPQGVAVNLPAGFSFTTQEVANYGLNILVQTSLRSVITTHPKTGAILSVQRRPVQVLRSFPTGTSFSSNSKVTSVIGGTSKTFTDRSNDANGYFEVTYKVEEVWVPVLALF